MESNCAMVCDAVRGAARNGDLSRGVKHAISALGSLGLCGLAIPEKDGGLGMGYKALCTAMENVSAVNPSVGLAYAAHSDLCLGQIARHGSDEQKKRFLPDILSGKRIGGLAMTEPNAGSDVFAMKSKAVRKPNGDYVLNGVKTFITNGVSGEVFVVYAKTRPDLPGSKGVSAFIVEKGAKGFSAGPKFDKIGMRECDTSELRMDNVVVPAANLLRKEGDGAKILLSGLNTERLVLAAGPLGIMRACLDTVIPYAKQRKQFGKPIANHQLIQEKMANMYAMYKASSAMVYSIADDYDKGKKSHADCAAAILFAAENATRVAIDAVQCLGGYGYTREYPVGGLMNDAKLYEIGAGTSEMRRVVIAKDLIKNYQSMN